MCISSSSSQTGELSHSNSLSAAFKYYVTSQTYISELLFIWTLYSAAICLNIVYYCITSLGALSSLALLTKTDEASNVLCPISERDFSSVDVDIVASCSKENGNRQQLKWQNVG